MKENKKRSLNYPIFTSYDIHYRFFWVGVGGISMDVMGLRTFALDIIWTGKVGLGSWKPIKIWNLLLHCGRSSSKKKMYKTCDWRQQNADVRKHVMWESCGTSGQKNRCLEQKCMTKWCKDLKKKKKTKQKRTFLMFGQSHLSWSYSVLARATSGHVFFWKSIFFETLHHMAKNHFSSFIYLFLLLFCCCLPLTDPCWGCTWAGFYPFFFSVQIRSGRVDTQGALCSLGLVDSGVEP